MHLHSSEYYTASRDVPLKDPSTIAARLANHPNEWTLCALGTATPMSSSRAAVGPVARGNVTYQWLEGSRRAVDAT